MFSCVRPWPPGPGAPGRTFFGLTPLAAWPWEPGSTVTIPTRYRKAGTAPATQPRGHRSPLLPSRSGHALSRGEMGWSIGAVRAGGDRGAFIPILSSQNSPPAIPAQLCPRPDRGAGTQGRNVPLICMGLRSIDTRLRGHLRRGGNVCSQRLLWVRSGHKVLLNIQPSHATSRYD
jgi:hypothetical protein